MAINQSSVENYLQLVEGRLGAEGYSRVESGAESAAVFHRRRLEFKLPFPIPFPFNRDWIFTWDEGLAPEDFDLLVNDSITWGLGRAPALQGGSAGVLFVVLITANLSQDRADLITGARPPTVKLGPAGRGMKGRFAFPVAVGLEPKTLTYPERTPLAGAIRYGNFRKSAARICTP